MSASASVSDPSPAPISTTSIAGRRPGRGRRCAAPCSGRRRSSGRGRGGERATPTRGARESPDASASLTDLDRNRCVGEIGEFGEEFGCHDELVGGAARCRGSRVQVTDRLLSRLTTVTWLAAARSPGPCTPTVIRGSLRNVAVVVMLAIAGGAGTAISARPAPTWPDGPSRNTGATSPTSASASPVSACRCCRLVDDRRSPAVATFGAASSTGWPTRAPATRRASAHSPAGCGVGRVW